MMWYNHIKYMKILPLFYEVIYEKVNLIFNIYICVNVYTLTNSNYCYIRLGKINIFKTKKT